MIEEDAATATAERLRGYVVLAVTVGARVAEVQAAKRRDAMREAERVSVEAARQMAMRQQFEAGMLRHQFRDVNTAEWWDRASPAEVGSVFATARSYSPLDPELASLTLAMGEQIQQRYGVDAEGVAARAERAAQRAEAVTYLAEADIAEGLVVPEELRAAVSDWDDPRRRWSLTDRLPQSMPGDPDAQQARLAADELTGGPVAQAAASTVKSTGKARVIKPARANTLER